MLLVLVSEGLRVFEVFERLGNFWKSLVDSVDFLRGFKTGTIVNWVYADILDDCLSNV